MAVVADPSNTMPLCHSCNHNLLFCVDESFCPLAYATIFADLGVTSTENVWLPSKMPCVVLFELLAVRCTL